MPAGVGLEQRLARPARPARPRQASPGAPLHCMRILSKGPEYLRLHFEGSQRGRVSVRERLEADRAKYVKSRRDGEPGPAQAGGDRDRHDVDGDDCDAAAANGAANGGGHNLNLEVLNNAINVLQRSPRAEGLEAGCRKAGGPEQAAPPCRREASDKAQAVDANGNDGSVFKAGHVKFLRRFFQGMGGGGGKDPSPGVHLPSGAQPMKSSPEHRLYGGAESEDAKASSPESQHARSPTQSGHQRHHHHHQPPEASRRGSPGEAGVSASADGVDGEPRPLSSDPADAAAGSRRRLARPVSLPESAFACRSPARPGPSSSPPPPQSAPCASASSWLLEALAAAGRGADATAAFFDGCGVEPRASSARARPARFESASAATAAVDPPAAETEEEPEERASSGAQWDDPDFDGLSARRSSAGAGEGADADPDLAEHSPSMVSVIERNARIIKWLYSCRQALAADRQPRN